jgi:hypothetical protein
MRLATLTLNPSARVALLAYMASITEYQPVASVVWNIAGSSGWLGPGGSEHFEFRGPHWSLGFSNVERFPEGVVSEIDGIPFVLDAGRHSSRLVGAVLDYSNGEFVIHESSAA